MDQLEREKLLDASVLALLLPTFVEFKKKKKSPCSSAKGNIRVIIVNYNQSIFYNNGQLSKGKVITRALSHLGKGIPFTLTPLALLSHLRGKSYITGKKL